MSDRPEKLDSCGQPFCIRNRGGSKAHKSEELANRVHAGKHVPKQVWSDDRRRAFESGREVSGPERRAGAEDARVEGELEGATESFTSFVRVLAPPKPESNNPPSRGPAKVSSEAGAAKPPPAAACSGFVVVSVAGALGVNSDSESSAANSGSWAPAVSSGSVAPESSLDSAAVNSGSVAPESSLGSRQRRADSAALPIAKSRAASSAVETSFRVVSDFHFAHAPSFVFFAYFSRFLYLHARCRNPQFFGRVFFRNVY